MKKNWMKYAAIAACMPLLMANEGCEAQPSAKAIEQAAIANNQQRLINDIPPPQLKTSLERKNLVERLQRINQQNMSGCIYLISQGTIMAMYPVRGKVTSLNAYLMGAEQVEYHSDAGGGNVTLEQPDFDGAYGKNADGVFFFTADTNSYVEWQGEYLFTDQCLPMNQQPKLVREVK